MTHWIAFFVLAAGMIALDLFVFDRKAHEPSFGESVRKTVLYVAVALGYGVWITMSLGTELGLQFFTGYALEMSLSFDNVFVISLIFGALAIPPAYRARVLFWGIIGAMVLRGIFIGLGAAIVSQFHWVLMLFAVFLLWTGAKMLLKYFKGGDEDEGYDPEQTRTVKLLRRFIDIGSMNGAKFFTRQKRRFSDISPPLSELPQRARDRAAGIKSKAALLATPLFVALVLVEVTDLIFAVDSIPATFSITTNPLIVFTSNIFAIVGLRSLFFVLQAMVKRFEYLTPALSIVLVFIGAKVLAAELLHIHMPVSISLGIVLGILAGGIFVSLIRTKDHGQDQPDRTA